jgi:hypothetical protein
MAGIEPSRLPYVYDLGQLEAIRISDIDTCSPENNHIHPHAPN